MTSLTDRIRLAQIQAGEEAVLADLRKRGLLDPGTPAPPDKDAEIDRLRKALSEIVEARMPGQARRIARNALAGATP